MNNSPDANADRDNTSLRRSGAVAKILGMPVATLRVWERRYELTQPTLSPSGQRLYSADDIQRLVLIKQLTELGHTIGSLARLDVLQLQSVAATHAPALATSAQAKEAIALSNPRPWRLALVGPALGTRLQRPALLRRIGVPVQLLGPYSHLAEAAARLNSADLDAVLIHQPQLHPDWLAAMHEAAPGWGAISKAVLFGFAAEAVCESLAMANITLLREPQPDAVIAQWLHGLSKATPVVPRAVETEQTIRPRRWDDTALADFAQRSSTIACECPRHIAELLMQLSHFEAYSAQCANRQVADAELHSYLRRVAANARAEFEAALEYVAACGGLPLPRL